jgi:hypothetical protein
MGISTDPAPQGVVSPKEKSEILELETPESTSAHGALTWTPEEEKKLVRKIDLMLLPTIWLMYLLSYMDRTK